MIFMILAHPDPSPVVSIIEYPTEGHRAFLRTFSSAQMQEANVAGI